MATPEDDADEAGRDRATPRAAADATRPAADAGATDADRRAALAAIVASGRATRSRPSRAAWSAAVLVGAVCAAGFVFLAVDGGPSGRDAGDAAAPRAPPAAERAGAAGCRGGGFGAGLGVGLGLGFALGARRRARSGQAGGGDHSSRRSP